MAQSSGFGAAEDSAAALAGLFAAGADAKDHFYRQLVQYLPAAIYTCDAQGRIQLYNDAAVELWGRAPKIGVDQWCGSVRVYAADGSPVPLETCPMAIALTEGRAVRGVEMIVERPDGSRRIV